MTDLSREKWYHGRVSRIDAEKIIDSQGAMEGMYLVRDSLTMTGEYVLSLCSQVILLLCYCVLCISHNDVCADQAGTIFCCTWK